MEITFTLELNTRFKLKVIQAYASISKYSDEYFYENTSSDARDSSLILITDFNAKICSKKFDFEHGLELHPYGERNDRVLDYWNFL